MKPHVALLVLLAIFSGCENHDITPEARVIHLKSVTSYFEHDAGNFQPASRTEYAYDAEGDLSQKSYSTYDIMEQNFNHTILEILYCGIRVHFIVDMDCDELIC